MNQEFPPAQSSRTQRALLLILALTLIVRLGAAYYTQQIDPERFRAPDTSGYENPALAILEAGRFSVSPHQLDQPEIMRTPGYPAFLAGVYGLWGQKAFAVAVIQILISLGIMLLVYGLAHWFFGPKAALIAAVFLALDPGSFLYPQKLLAETLFTFFLIASLATGCLAYTRDKTKWAWLLALGALTALATLIRPVTYYLILPLIILTCLNVMFKVKRPLYMPFMILFLILPWLVLVGGWQARNYHISGSARLSQIVGENLLKHWAAPVLADKEGISREQAAKTLMAQAGGRADESPDPAATYRNYTQLGLKVLRDNPGLAFKGLLRGLFGELMIPVTPELLAYVGLDPGSGGAMGDVPRLSGGEYWRKWITGRPLEFITTLAGLVYLLAIYAGCAAGLWSLGKERGGFVWPHALLWLVILYILAISAAPTAYGRVRHPVMPLLCLYAGAGWAWLWGRKKAD